MSGDSGKADPPRKEPVSGEEHRSGTGGQSPLSDLHVALLRMDAAVIAEGIDPNAPLGVFCHAQRAMIMAMISTMENMVSKVDERAGAVEAAMNAEVDRVRVAIEQMRQETLKFRAETNNLKAQQLKVADDMAVRMADKIQECLKRTMLVREKRWNLRQNLRLVGLGVVVLFATFLGGQWMQGHSMARGIIERCHAHPAIDPETKIAYCAMSKVDGLPDANPSSTAR